MKNEEWKYLRKKYFPYSFEFFYTLYELQFGLWIRNDILKFVPYVLEEKILYSIFYNG